MLPKWENRSEIVASLINPAFASEVIRESVEAYKSEAKNSCPFEMVILILPFILNGSIRTRLPNSKSTNFLSWINDNEDLKIGLSNNISGFLPFTRESILFGVRNETLRMTDDGEVMSLIKKRKPENLNAEVDECYKKARVLGKMLAVAKTSMTVYSALGIRP